MTKIVKNLKSIITKPFVFLSNWRSLPTFEMLSYFLMYASIPMLAYGLNNYDYDIIFKEYWGNTLTLVLQ